MVVEIPVTEARAQFAELINRVGYGGEKVVLTRHGKPLVALVPAPALDSTAGAGNEVLLDLTSQPDKSRSQFQLTAQDRTPPHAGG